MPRTVPAGMLADLRSGTAYTAMAFIVTRRDGTIFGFTDHDRAIVVDGVRCAPETGLDSSSIDTTVGSETDGLDVQGLLDSDAITIDDIEGGLWDGAAVRVLRVSWRDPAQFAVLAECVIHSITRQGDSFSATLESASAAFSQVSGRTALGNCDATLGDDRCGLDVTALQRSGHVSAVYGSASISAAVADDFNDGHWTYGVVTWANGARSEVRRHEGQRLWFWEPLSGIDVGTAFTLTPGCDRSWAACQGFANSDNFRGFPHMPGTDNVLAISAAGASDDQTSGGSLFRTEPPPPVIVLSETVSDSAAMITFEPVPFTVRALANGLTTEVWGLGGAIHVRNLEPNTEHAITLTVLSTGLESEAVTVVVLTQERDDGGGDFGGDNDGV
ncbi:MAG: DUF2163 domain-containing protein [Neomegalonema sp.]|nr:DUF2163 domain-containing protein [Neomegalonema sp.]